ncbi:hypothetical protein Bca101_020503 [Brassica carinata]
MSLIPSFFGGRRTNVFDPFSLDLYDPFEGFLTPSGMTNATSKDVAAFTNAKVDWRETPEAHVFKADLPGLKKEEVKVEVEDGNILQISGERSSENEEKSDKWHRVERSSGKFMRRFKLPENAKIDEVKACMENGVLSVMVPKVPERKPEDKGLENRHLRLEKFSFGEDSVCGAVVFLHMRMEQLKRLRPKWLHLE